MTRKTNAWLVVSRGGAAEKEPPPYIIKCPFSRRAQHSGGPATAASFSLFYSLRCSVRPGADMGARGPLPFFLVIAGKTLH